VRHAPPRISINPSRSERGLGGAEVARDPACRGSARDEPKCCIFYLATALLEAPTPKATLRCAPRGPLSKLRSPGDSTWTHLALFFEEVLLEISNTHRRSRWIVNDDVRSQNHKVLILRRSASATYREQQRPCPSRVTPSDCVLVHDPIWGIERNPAVCAPAVFRRWNFNPAILLGPVRVEVSDHW